MSPSSDRGFPGMEHQRTSDVLPNQGYTEAPQTPPAGPTRATRERALELAVNLVNHNSFHTPGKVALDFAEVFAQYLHDGSRDPK